MNNTSEQSPSRVPVAPEPELQVEAIEREKRIIPVERRISWLGWLVALLIFPVSKKISIGIIVVLLVFRQFPTLNMKNLPGKAGSLWRKLRN